MLSTVAVTILALAASVVLTLAGQGNPVAVAHLAFAIGIVPLIVAAMTHFVPVLTRTGDPAAAIRRLPFVAQAAGLLAVAAMAGLIPRAWLHLAALADFLVAATLLGWIVGRAKRCLGQPHPGWRWYGAALGCLLATMAAVPAMAALPAQYAAFRALHLHGNVLGLVALAALGTLPVLLPTALGKPDPEAAGWLRRYLWPAVTAAITTAVGAACCWFSALVGAMLWLLAVLALALQWRRRFGIGALAADGAAAPLAAALAGFAILLVFGAAHGAKLLPARPAIAAWAAGFLLPLVSGALTQLLPVWRWSGPVTPARSAMRARLATGGRWRALCFLAGGVLLALGQTAAGGAFAGLGMIWFVAVVVWSLGVPAAAR